MGDPCFAFSNQLFCAKAKDLAYDSTLILSDYAWYRYWDAIHPWFSTALCIQRDPGYCFNRGYGNDCWKKKTR